MPFSCDWKLLGGVTAAAAIGLLIIPTPAQAYPPAPLAPGDCTAYQFPGGTVTLNYPGIGRTVFDTAAPNTHVDTKATTIYDNGTDMPGSVLGDVKGTTINVKVTREGYTPLVLKGQIGAGSRAHGDYTFRQNESGIWDSSEEFVCAPGAAEAPQAPTQQKTTFVVGGPVDIYNIAHDEVPDPNNGIQGVKIGTLEDGQLVVRADGGPCAQNSWCKIVMPGDPEHFGFVNGHLQ